MILLTAQSQIRVATTAQDFRKGIDGFASLCRHELGENPQSGIIFVFINRSKTMIRILTYEENGFWLMTKRLSKGKFRYWPDSGASVTTLMGKQLRCILQDKGDAREFHRET